MLHIRRLQNHTKCLVTSTDQKTPSSPQEEKSIFYGHEIPLHQAVYAEDLQRITDLIKRGDDINQTDTLGKTALHYAARNGNRTIIVTLLTAGADIQLADFGGEGSTPLEIAIESGFQNIFLKSALTAIKQTSATS